MRVLFIFTVLTLTVSAPALADPAKLAVFDFELLDTSLQGEVNGPRTDEHDRRPPLGITRNACLRNQDATRNGLLDQRCAHVHARQAN